MLRDRALHHLALSRAARPAPVPHLETAFVMPQLRPDSEPLIDFLPRITPRYKGQPSVRPVHLGRVVEALSRARREPVQAVVSAPPRHGKTELLTHWIAWLLMQDPTERIAYVSYSEKFARTQSRRARYLAALAGVVPGDARSLREWTTREGGGLVAVGINGDLEGRGFDKIVIDDPVKNIIEANSPVMREKMYQFILTSAEVRLEPGGSVFLCMHRWHEDDLAARMTRDGWEDIRLPALSEDVAETALWESRWSRKYLMALRQRKPHTFEGLYQGRPRPKGDRVFREVKTYSRLPPDGVDAYGVDCAYSAKTRSDKSVLLRLRRVDREGYDANNQPLRPLFYVMNVIAKRCRITDFYPDLQLAQARAPGARMRWYIAGQEPGIVDLLREKEIEMEVLPASTDKLKRATPVSEAWNAGEILVPGKPDDWNDEVDGDYVAPEWVEEFLEVVINFTGLPGGEDDEVDALAAGYDQLADRGQTVAQNWARADPDSWTWMDGLELP